MVDLVMKCTVVSLYHFRYLVLQLAWNEQKQLWRNGAKSWKLRGRTAS